VEALISALRPGRVVTLYGPGGIGKSAVAAEALHRLTADGTKPPAQFPDGVVWHEFYNAPEALRALEHIARSFGQTPDPTPREAALRALAGRKALILLDGAEDADDLPAVLSVVGECAVIVTTRNRHDAGPDRLEINALPDDESADLLKAWGRDQTRDAQAVRRICDLLGGLPLAICLVGGYLDETGDTAADYLQWLETTPLDALDQGERKRDSVPLLLKRSLDQVGQTARDILYIAGILAFAPFTPDALAAALQIQPRPLKRPLNELAGYSLLARTGNRYQLKHALIHTYARENHPPTDDALQRLAGFYTDLAREHRDHGLEGYARLDPDRPHILQTLTACRDRQLWEPVRKLVWAIQSYLSVRGHWAECRAALHAGVDAAKALKDRRDEGAHMGHLGNAYSDLGQVETAIDHYQQALAIHREIGGRKAEGSDLGNLGLAYSDLGQVEKAIDHHQQALAIAREIGDRRNEGNWLGNLGNAYSDLGQVEKAIDHYQQALAISREIGDRRAEGSILGNLGNAYRNRGEVEKAIDHYQQALAISREIGDRRSEGAHLGNLGIAYRNLGQVEKAIDHHQQALAIRREIGDRRGEGNHLGNLGNAYSDLGQVEKAIDHHQQALAIAREIGDRRGEGNRLGNLGLAYRALGQMEKARAMLAQSLAIFEEIQSPSAELVRKWLAELDNGGGQ